VVEIDVAHTGLSYTPETGLLTVPEHSVMTCLSPHYADKVCRLTRRILKERVQIVVGCSVVAEPVVTTPACDDPCFVISVSTEAKAKTLGEMLRAGNSGACG